MRKQRIEYKSPVDALIVIAKRLSLYEKHYQMESEEFLDKFSKGFIEDTQDFVEWSNDYQHYMALKFELETCAIDLLF